VTGPSRDELVPQELPYGTSMASFGLRGGGAMPMESLSIGGGMPAAGAMRTRSKMSAPQSKAAPSSFAISKTVSREERDSFAPMALPVAPAPVKRRRAVWPIVALLAALIAFLIWWLAL